MSAVDDDVATRHEDVAYDLAGRKNPSIQEGIAATADEGGMGNVQNNYVGSLASGEAAN
jgi:hypothetical protein